MPDTLRQTLLRYADNCPHSAMLYMRHGVAPRAPLMRGRAFHLTAERAIRAMVANGEQSIGHHDAKAILEEVLSENTDWIVPVAEMDCLRVMVFHFAEHFRLPSPDVQVERLFHMASGERVISGTVDLLWAQGDTLFIRDWKASLGFASRDDVAGRHGAKAFQLIVYTLLAADGRPVEEDWELPPGINHFDVAFVYPFHLAADESGMLERGTVIDRADLIEHRAWLRSLVARVDKGLATGVWPALAGSHCQTCPLPSACPLPEVFRPDEADPEDLAEGLLFLEQGAKDAKERLKAHVARYGPVRVGDMELSHKRADARRLTKAGREKLEAGQPVPPEEYALTESTRFGWRKAGEGF